MCLSSGVLTGHHGREWTTDALYVSSGDDSILTHFKIELCIFKEFLLYLGVGEDLYKKKKKDTLTMDFFTCSKRLKL